MCAWPLPSVARCVEPLDHPLGDLGALVVLEEVAGFGEAVVGLPSAPGDVVDEVLLGGALAEVAGVVRRPRA